MDSPPPSSAALPGRRISARIAVRGAAAVDLPGGATRNVQTWDVGSDGVSVMSPRPISPGTRCKIRFELPLAFRSASVAVSAKAIYSSYTGADGFRVGFVFIALDADAERVIAEFLR